MPSKKEAMPLGINMSDIDDAFDLLHELSNININEHGNFYNEENTYLINILWDDLFGRKISINNVKDFNDTVLELSNREAQLSRDLGIAILTASDFSKAGKVTDAIAVLKDFINCCASKSYREIAEIEKDNLDNYPGG